MKTPGILAYYRALVIILLFLVPFNPGCLSQALDTPPLEWKKVGNTAFPIPPKHHPRLYLNPKEVYQLESRFSDPVLMPLVEAMKDDAKAIPQARIEWDAMQFLMHRDEKLGRPVIKAAIAFLRETELGKQNDAARVTGRAMVTGALVYDWLYPVITPDEKQIIIQELIRLAKTLECGYPPVRQGNITSHSSESFIMCDMLSAGIAIYDEFPEMYELAAARFFGEMLPARNWFYNGHAHHQGDSYGFVRFGWDLYPLFIFDRMGVKSVYNPEQQFVPYYFIYASRPDGSLMRSGDTFLHSWNKPGTTWPMGETGLLTASYYRDGIVMDQYMKSAGSGDKPKNRLFMFLWWNTGVKTTPVNTLPLTKYFGNPFGWMIARTGWDENAVIAEMKINEYNFVNHQHLDAGSFQVYYRAPLATESGLYKGSDGEYGSMHNLNYYKRTIAHNSLLIYDPSETFRQNHGNDGGQRLPNGRSEAADLNTLFTKGYKTGEILAHDAVPEPRTPVFSYLKGDITPAYSEKVSGVKRSFVFVNLGNAEVPAALIVFDKVVSVNPDFKKFWLLHSISEPVIHGNEAIITQTGYNGTGKLINTCLLPESENAEFTPVGGPGKEFWVFGINYANNPEMGESNCYENAAWRMEISPKMPEKENYFLNVMQIMDENASKYAVERIDTDKLVGVPIANHQVFFSKNHESISNQAAFPVKGTGKVSVFVSDLDPGKWRLLRNNVEFIPEITVKENSGVIAFDGTQGNYVLEKMVRPEEQVSSSLPRGTKVDK
jgi:heparin/heparan-sulfate lyase